MAEKQTLNWRQRFGPAILLCLALGIFVFTLASLWPLKPESLSGTYTNEGAIISDEIQLKRGGDYSRSLRYQSGQYLHVRNEAGIVEITGTWQRNRDSWLDNGLIRLQPITVKYKPDTNTFRSQVKYDVGNRNQFWIESYFGYTRRLNYGDIPWEKQP